MSAKKKATAGWIFTFADLMALILTFFVLLLSFSTIDAKKYEELVRSFGSVFGRGTGIILDHGVAIRSPISVTITLPQSHDTAKGSRDASKRARPHPTDAARDGEQDLAVAPVPADDPPVSSLNKPAAARSGDLKAIPEISETPSTSDAKDPAPLSDEHGSTRAARLFETLQAQFWHEIDAGLVELDMRDDDVHVRFREAISFPSGEAVISRSFHYALDRMGAILHGTKGRILISGHTDDRPIASERFRSNWELSAARAVSVVHYLVNSSDIPKQRLVAQGYADTVPVSPNDSAEHRARNRRVEITIRPASSVN